jgi:hypothetical protein
MKKVSKSKKAPRSSKKTASKFSEKDLLDPSKMDFQDKKSPTTESSLDLKDIKNWANFLNKAYDSLVRYVEGEHNRLLNMQVFIGEAVTQELLHQSYGIPEYTDEERLKRLLACISKAIDNYYKAKKEHATLKNYEHERLWDRPDDPHTIGSVYEQEGSDGTRIDTSTIRIGEISVKQPPAREENIPK